MKMFVKLFCNAIFVKKKLNLNMLKIKNIANERSISLYSLI